MEFAFSDKVEELRSRLAQFMDTHVISRLADYKDEIHCGVFPVFFMDDLKQKARADGLWNLFLPLKGAKTLSGPW